MIQNKYINTVKVFNKLLETEKDPEVARAYYTALDCIIQVIAFEEAAEARRESNEG